MVVQSCSVDDVTIFDVDLKKNNKKESLHMRFSEEHTLQKCVDYVESMRDLIDSSDLSSDIKNGLNSTLDAFERQVETSFDLI